MARINIDEDFWSDPRLEIMAQLKPRYECVGAILILWRLGQMYWRRGRQLIPCDVFENIPLSAELVKAKFAIMRDDGVYCAGAADRWTCLNPEQQSAAGKKSADARRRKYGNAIPVNAVNGTIENAVSSNARRTESNITPLPLLKTKKVLLLIQ